jgi:sec-independent protein translocase protein TatA
MPRLREHESPACALPYHPCVPFGLGVWEIAILVGVLVLLFGAKGVPDVARRLGTGMREVKDAVAEVDPRRMLDAGDAEKPQPPREPPRRDDA